MAEPVRIVVTLEGGRLSAVYTLGVPVEVLLIDYDAEAAGPEDVAVARREAARPIDPALLVVVERLS